MRTRQKRVFAVIFFGLIFLLLTLPFTLTVNDVLTRLVQNNFLYAFIQRSIVPIEAKMIGIILKQFRYTVAYSPANSILLVNGLALSISWNCIGWQSFLLFIITLFVGLRTRYTLLSRLEILGFGAFGTFWVNILRMLLTILLAVHTPPVFRIVFHDYLAALTTIAWLFCFWWYAYRFVLEEKAPAKPA